MALMSMRSQTNRLTHLTPHEMLTGRPMPVPYLRGPYEGPPLEQMERELTSYVQHLTQIHKVIFQQVKGATEEREANISSELQKVNPGDWVYVKVFKRKWDQPRREGSFKVSLATPTALKVEGKKVWFHLNHCCRAEDPEGTAEAYRGRARPGSEGGGDTTPQEASGPEGEGDTAPQEARRSQSPQGERRSQRLAARRPRSSSTSSGSLATRQESDLDSDNEPLTSPTESPRAHEPDPDAGPSGI